LCSPRRAGHRPPGAGRRPGGGDGAREGGSGGLKFTDRQPSRRPFGDQRLPRLHKGPRSRHGSSGRGSRASSCSHPRRPQALFAVGKSRSLRSTYATPTGPSGARRWRRRAEHENGFFAVMHVDVLARRRSMRRGIAPPRSGRPALRCRSEIGRRCRQDLGRPPLISSVVRWDGRWRLREGVRFDCPGAFGLVCGWSRLAGAWCRMRPQRRRGARRSEKCAPLRPVLRRSSDPRRGARPRSRIPARRGHR